MIKKLIEETYFNLREVAISEQALLLGLSRLRGESNKGLSVYK